MSFYSPGQDNRCDHCNRPGTPYEYRGITFDGLTSWEGERLCPACRDHKLDAETEERRNAPLDIGELIKFARDNR